MTVAAARAALEREEADKLLDTEQTDQGRRCATPRTTASCSSTRSTRSARARRRAGSAAATSRREGVQRDLLPLIEGTTVTTKYGPVKTDHILFIASGAYPPRQARRPAARAAGRLPIRVELAPLSRDDLRRILVEPEHSLLKQYSALLDTEQVRLDFTDDAVDALAELAADINDRVENIGARRLATVLEKLPGGGELHRLRPPGRPRPGRRRLRQRARGAARPQGGPQPVHPVEPASGPCCRGREESMFFLERKNQRTFAHGVPGPSHAAGVLWAKSFCFFFFRKRRPCSVLSVTLARQRPRPGAPPRRSRP